MAKNKVKDLLSGCLEEKRILIKNIADVSYAIYEKLGASIHSSYRDEVEKLVSKDTLLDIEESMINNYTILFK